MKKAKIIMVIGMVMMLAGITSLAIIAGMSISNAKTLSEELEHTKTVLSDVKDDCEFALDMIEHGCDYNAMCCLENAIKKN